MKGWYMIKIRVFLKSIVYSLNLTYKSCGFLLIGYVFISIIEPTLALAVTYETKLILDHLIGGSSISQIIFRILCYIGILIATQVCASVRKVLHDSVFNKAKHGFECQVREKLSCLPLSFIDSSRGRNVINDVEHTQATAVYTSYRVLEIFTSIYRFLIVFVVLIQFNLSFTLLFLALSIPGTVLNEVFDRKAEQLRLRTAPDMRKLCYYRWMLVDSWPAKDVRMYDLTEPLQLRYREERDRYVSIRKKLDRQKTCFFILAEFIARAGEIIFTIFVIYEALHKRISIGDVSLYIGFALTAFNSFRTISYNVVVVFDRTTREMSRLFHFFDMETEEKQTGRRTLTEFTSLIFDHVYFKYPHTEQYVLSGVSFAMNRGDKLSIVGVNGSGKSTMIKLMLGLYEVESGQILINGYPLSDYDIKDVRKLFSALFQTFVQYPLTLRENIALSDLERLQNDEEIIEVLNQSEVYEDIKLKLENGLDSFMTRQFDDKGTELSKGQWQKVALSRAYFKNASIIIFDEPSAALDAEAEDRIFRNFEEISEGKTGIMISHRISSSRMSNKIIVLDGGKITEQGTHDELVAKDGLYAKLYNLQREKYTMQESGETV